MRTKFPHLLAPGRIGQLELRNRLIMTAMGTNTDEEGGFVSERTHAYFTERAKGGVGLIIMGSVGVAFPIGGAAPRQLAISTDAHIPAIKALADSVHSHGAKIAVQLHYAGLMGMEDMLAGRPVWTPSIPEAKQGDWLDGFLEEELEAAPFTKLTHVEYNVMTKADIQKLVELFAAGADRAKRAGIDGLEIHGGHGYIISSFLSPLTNQRTDEYGGSVENRARLLVEIIKGVRQTVGRDFPVWCKIDSQEFLLSEGICVEDAAVTARLAQAAGADAITVSSYHDTSKGLGHSNSNIPDPEDLMVANATAIKAAVSIPVITSGRIELDKGEEYIAGGKFDFLALGRKLLADPHLANKLKEERPEDILPCVYCYTCVSQIYICKSARCAVNPETMFERELALTPAPTAKHVVVVGGGPGGMEAARRLDLKGHKVTLLEQSDRLGGTLQFASIAYRPNERILEWLRRQVGKSRVDVKLKTQASLELLKSLRPDEVVVASGAIRKLPPIPGADRANVFSGDDMRRMVLGDDLESLKGKTSLGTRLAMKAGAMTGATKNLELIREATRKWMPLGERIVIIGGELVGLELAEFLAERGRKVTVIDETARFGAGLQVVRRWRVLAELKEAGVALLSRARDIRIEEGAVSYTNYRNQTRTLTADHIIVAKGATGDVSFAEQLRAAGFKVHTVGDCNGVGYIEGAIRGAAEAVQGI